jgi:DNA-binding NarL/FixJ family response regulator
MVHRILIVDDSAAIRQCLRSSIERQKDLQVCGEAENGENAVARVKELIPDLVILDLQMPVMNGLDAARRIAQIAPQLPMLMFTMYSSEYLVTEARAAGIKDVFSKSTGIPDRLISAIQEILGSENGSENASRNPATTPAKRSESDA